MKKIEKIFANILLSCVALEDVDQTKTGIRSNGIRSNRQIGIRSNGIRSKGNHLEKRSNGIRSKGVRSNVLNVPQ